VGGSVSTLGMMMLTWATAYTDLIAAVCMFGIGGGISMPAISALAVIKGEEKKAMASIMSVMTVAQSLGMFTGSMAAGIVMDFYNLGLSFPCGAFIMAVGTLCYFLFSSDISSNNK